MALFVSSLWAGDRPVLASAAAAPSPQWAWIVVELFGGLALFLFGLDQMSGGLKSAAGARMKDILSRFTSNRFKAVVTGCVVTAVIQSSSVTTVLVVGFVSAGVMSLAQSVGIIMGANIGTTITAQIIAFKVTQYAMALIAIGFFLLFASKRDQLKQIGSMAMGIGLIFFGMGIMSDAMYPLRGYEPFVSFMQRMEDPLLAILVATVFTALVQSSAATIGIVIALASQGVMSLESGIALILGANVGTCITAVLAAIGKNREVVRVAAVHVLFNVIGVLIWFGLIPWLAHFARALSPHLEGLEGAAKLAAEAPRQIVNAHTVFNLANTLLLLPFTGLLAKLVVFLFPRGREKSFAISRFLSSEALAVPALAIHNARLETARLGEVVLDMLKQVPEALNARTARPIDEIEIADDDADALQGQILLYMGSIRKLELSDGESREFQNLMIAIDALERVGDVISNDMTEICRKKLYAGMETSSSMQEMLGKLHVTLVDCLVDLVEALRGDESGATRRILAQKAEVHRLINEVFLHQERRASELSAETLALFRVEMDFVEKQRRIYSLIKRMAHYL